MIVVDRRRVLRGLLGGAAVTVGLPRLEAMLNGHGEAYASGERLPVRFGVWAFANGVHLERWVPTATGKQWSLSEQLAPLEAVRPYLSVVSGMKLPFGGRVHAAGNTVLMTGARLAGSDDSNYTARGPSIDQIVAQQVGLDTPLRSVEIGVDDGAPPEKGSAFHWWSHSGPNSPNPCSYDCAEVFRRLYGGPGEAAEQARRRSVLDAVLEDAADVRARLGGADRRRLDQHLEGVRGIERRIQRAASLTCAVPARPAAQLQGPSKGTDYEPAGTEVNRTMAELLALALSCDVTRVFTYQLTKPGSRIGLRSLGYTLYHNITHNEAGAQPMCSATVKFFMKELLVLAETFRRTPDGAGNLLDHCAILATTDCTNPKIHGIEDYPMLVLGRGGGGLRPGIHYRAKAPENACRVPLTLARVAGARLPAFGEGTGRTDEDVSALLA